MENGRERAAAVFITDGEILLVSRDRNANQYYVLPGGGIEPGESPEQAVIREMKEETGIDCTIEKALWQLTNNGQLEHYFLVNPAHKHTALSNDEFAKRPKDDSAALEWVSLYELRYANFVPEEAKERIITEFGLNFRWDKLVRDKLPEIIEARGRTSKWHIADDDEYWSELCRKLVEEAQEFRKNGTIKELADMYEIMDAIVTDKQFDKAQIEAVKKERLSERGGFKKRIILEESTGD